MKVAVQPLAMLLSRCCGRRSRDSLGLRDRRRFGRVRTRRSGTRQTSDVQKDDDNATRGPHKASCSGLKP